jgi:hypothetical protein
VLDWRWCRQCSSAAGVLRRRCSQAGGQGGCGWEVSVCVDPACWAPQLVCQQVRAVSSLSECTAVVLGVQGEVHVGLWGWYRGSGQSPQVLQGVVWQGVV